MTPTPICSACEMEMKLVPAGISQRTKKPYNAFYSCDKRAGGCGATQNCDSGAETTAPKSAKWSSIEELEARVSAIEEKLGMKEVSVEEIPF